MSQILRKLTYKIYNRSGTFVKVLDDVLNTPEWEYSVNSGLGEVVLQLNRKIDDYGEGTDLDLNYRLKIYLNDSDNTDKLVYTGYLTAFNPYVKGPDEGVEITFLPNISKIKNDYWRSSTSVLTGFAVQESATELGQIMENILDNYRTNGETDLLISNDYSNVDDTSETLTYLFKDIKHLDAIKKVAEFLPTNWYWYLNPDGKLYLKAKSASATHKFILRKHIKELETHKNIESVINHFFIWSGVGSSCPNYVDNDYSDATSKTNYGTIADLKIDSDIHTSAYADLIGNPEIAENKDPKRRITIVLGSEYDLASINPGDTCKVMDIDENQTLFGTNMSVVRILYKVDSAVLELTEFTTNLSELTQEREDVIQQAIDQITRSITSIEPEQLVLGSRDWVTNLMFSSTDHDTVSWTTGSIKVATSSASSPVTYSITAGNTGDIGATTAIYFQPATSTNSLQTSLTFSDAMGPDRIALCYAVPGADATKGATVVNIKPGLGMVIDGANIAVRTILAEQIAANAITSNEIYANTITTGELNFTPFVVGTDDLDDVSDGTTYSRVLTANITAGAIVLANVSGTLDNVSEGATYGKVLLTNITAGQIILSGCSGDLDDIGDGSTYSKVLTTNITAGAIVLANVSGDLDDVDDGSTYNKTTVNEVTGAGRAYTGFDINSIITKGFLEANLTSISLPTNGIRFDSNGIYGRKASATTFYISSAGDAYFTGTIAASTITGGTVTGSTLKTAGSGARVELFDSAGSGYIDVYDGSALRTRIVGSAVGISNLIIYASTFAASPYVGFDVVAETDTTKIKGLGIVLFNQDNSTDITWAFERDGSNAYFYSSPSSDIGTSGYPWSELFIQDIYITGGTHKIYGPYSSIVFDTTQSSAGGINITPGSDGLTLTGNLKFDSTSDRDILRGSNLVFKLMAADTVCSTNFRTDAEDLNLGSSTAGEHWNYIYGNYIRWDVDGTSFQDHDDIALMKEVKTVTKKGKKVFDKKSFPKEVVGDDNMFDMGNMQGFLIGTIKQLIEKVEKLENKVNS